MWYLSRSCAAVGCNTDSESRRNVRLYRFPFRHRERYQLWTDVAGNETLNAEKMKTAFLCSLHFPNNQFYNSDRYRLIRGAIPSHRTDSAEYLALRDRYSETWAAQAAAHSSAGVAVTVNEEVASLEEGSVLEAAVYEESVPHESTLDESISFNGACHSTPNPEIMPYKCFVPNCRGNYKTGPKVSTFSFPKNESLRIQWLKAIGRKDLISKDSRVCEIHFRKREVQRETVIISEADGQELRAPLLKPRLVDGAVPSQFLNLSRLGGQPVDVTLKKAAIPKQFPPDSSGNVSAPQKQGGPDTNNDSSPEIVLVESNVAWDSETSDISICEEPFQTEESKANYDELLETLRDQLCRVCGIKRDNLLPLYSVAEAVEEDVLTVWKKIELYLPLEINKEDGLPAYICVDCCTQIESWHEFLTTSVAADSILKMMFKARKKEPSPQSVTVDTRSDKENFLGGQVPAILSSENSSDTVSIRNTNIQEGSDVLQDNSDNVEEACRQLQNSCASIELEIKSLLRRLQEKLGEDLANIVKETEENPSDSVRNDHMYARDEQSLRTACEYCTQVSLRKVLGEDTVNRGNGDKKNCSCANNNKGTGNYKILNVFRELLEKLEEKIVKECNDVREANYFQDDHETLREKKFFCPVYSCVYCQQTFSRKETGVLHKKQCALGPAMCEICGRILKTRELKDHTARHNPGEICCICEKCGKIFTSWGGLKGHIKNFHTEKIYVCKPCCLVFSSCKKLRVHTKQHEKGEVGSLNLAIAESGRQGMFSCPVCMVQFQDKISVIVHMNERLKMQCMKCKGWILNERMSLMHKCPVITCRFCPKRFSGRSNKYAHERTHTGVKPFACKECGKTFASWSTLRDHRLTHKPPQYKCETCNKFFLRKTVYNDHMDFHAGMRHPCKFCPNIYNTRKALTMHKTKKHKSEVKSAKSKVVSS